MSFRPTLKGIMLSLLFFQCTPQHSAIGHIGQENSRRLEFRHFLKKFRILSSPFELDISCYQSDSKSILLDVENDSVFTDYKGPGIALGILADTSRYYSVIYATAASCYLPVLAIFSKDSKRIDRQSLSDGCGSDQDYFCSIKLMVEQENEVTVIKREEYVKVDDFGNRIAPPDLLQVITNRYFVGSNGKIEIYLKKE